MARDRRRVGTRGPLAAAASLCAGLTVAPAAWGNAPCRSERSILFSYPSVDAETTLPRNAEPLFVVAQTIHRVVLEWPGLDERSGPQRSDTREGTSFDVRFRPEVSGLLTPGRHEVVVQLDADANQLVGPDSYPLRFNVADVDAPLPDETSRVTITRVSRFWRPVGDILRNDEEAESLAAALPTDCSAEVGIQYSCERYSPRSRIGHYRIELEPEGPALGYAINDRYFVPARCRSAFFDDDAPYSIRVVTETGLGAESVYEGEVETVISSEPDPFATPEQPFIACSAGARGGSPSRAGVVGAALLALVAAARSRLRRVAGGGQAGRARSPAP